MKFLIIGLLSLSSFAFAQFESERVVSLEIAVQTEKSAKPYLLNQAVLTTIYANADSLGLDKESFEKQINAKFTAHFDGYKKRKAEDKFGKNFFETMSKEDQNVFFNDLEKYRQREFVSFTKLDRVLDSYAFRQIQKDQTNPKLWQGVVFLNLNKTKLQRYSSRLTSKGEKHYGSVKLLLEINPIGFAWKELGIEKVTSFTEPLQVSWLKWFSTNIPNNVEDVSICDESCYGDFENWQFITQEQGMRIPENIRNNLWLKVSYNLRKDKYLESIQEWSFSWEGSVVLLDVNTKKILGSYNLPSEHKTWRNLEPKDLNSSIVSALYRSPMDSFTKINKKIQDSPRLNGLSSLVVSGHKNLGDVISLIDLLKKSSTTSSLELSLSEFSTKQAKLLAFYQGEEKTFTDILTRVKELKSTHRYSLVPEYNGVQHELKLIAE